MGKLQERLGLEMFGVPRLSFGERLLGPIQTRHTVLLLAYLVTFPRSHSREELVDLIWPDSDLEHGRHSLSQAIWWVKAQIERVDREIASSIFVTSRATLALNSDLIDSDVGFR